MSLLLQWMDLIDQHDQHKPGCGRGHDGRRRLFHRERCAGCHPAENGMMPMWMFTTAYTAISLFVLYT